LLLVVEFANHAAYLIVAGVSCPGA